jgi:hypothetical protein
MAVGLAGHYHASCWVGVAIDSVHYIVYDNWERKNNMAPKKHIQLCVTDDDDDLLLKLSQAEKAVALVGENGYRPAVVHRLLEAWRKSGLTPTQFADGEWLILLITEQYKYYLTGSIK